MNVRDRIGEATQRWIEFVCSNPRRTTGIAVARIGLCCAALHFYLSSYAERAFLWGPRAFLTLDNVRTDATTRTAKSLYVLATSSFSFELLFHIGIAVAVLFMIFGGRVLAAAHAIFLWSLYQRNGMLLDGGDNFAQIAVILMIFTQNNLHFAVGASKRRAVLEDRMSPTVGSVLHNCAAVLLVFQVAVIYTVAGSWKLIGTRWHEGNALYYITRIDEFSFLPLFRWLTANALIVTAMSYGTILVQLSFLPLIFTRYRSIAVLGVTCMHISIALSMGLVGFGLNMVSGDAICLAESDYARSHAFWRGLVGAVRRRLVPVREGPVAGLRARPAGVTPIVGRHRREYV